MNQFFKVVALILLLIANLMLALSGAWLFYEYIRPRNANPDRVAHQSLDQSLLPTDLRLAGLIRNYRYYDSHPEVSLQRSKLWFQSTPLQFAALYNGADQLIFRMRKKAELSDQSRADLIQAFARRQDRRPGMRHSITLAGQNWQLGQESLIVIRSDGSP